MAQHKYRIETSEIMRVSVVYYVKADSQKEALEAVKKGTLAYHKMEPFDEKSDVRDIWHVCQMDVNGEIDVDSFGMAPFGDIPDDQYESLVYLV